MSFVTFLLTNGDLSSLLLFGSLGLFTSWSIISANKRGATPTSKKQTIPYDILVAVVGIMAFAIHLYFHGSLFGIAIF